MIAYQIYPVVVFDAASACLVYTPHTQERLCGYPTEQHDQARVDQFDLLEEIQRRTGVYFGLSWHTILLRAALHGVGNKQIVAVHAAPRQHLIQETSGGTNKRLAVFVFIA